VNVHDDDRDLAQSLAGRRDPGHRILEMEGLTHMLTEGRDGDAWRLGGLRSRSRGDVVDTIQGACAQSLTGRRDGTIRRTGLSEHRTVVSHRSWTSP